MSTKVNALWRQREDVARRCWAFHGFYFSFSMWYAAACGTCGICQGKKRRRNDSALKRHVGSTPTIFLILMLWNVEMLECKHHFIVGCSHPGTGSACSKAWRGWHHLSLLNEESILIPRLFPTPRGDLCRFRRGLQDHELLLVSRRDKIPSRLGMS